MLLFIACSLGAIAVTAGVPLQIGSRKQLFIDKRFIAASNGIELHTNPAQKLGLIFDETGNPSSESGHTSRVIMDDGKIRLYVGAGDLFVLESEDGLRFKRTAIQIGRGELPTIFLDPHDPDPARRYKLFWLQAKNPFDSKTDGIFAAYSADGSHFSTVGRVLPFLIDNPTVVDWDERIGKYIIFTRTFSYDSENQRRITRIETTDPLKPWPYLPGNPKQERLSIENAPAVLEADKEDNAHSDIYYNAATIYPWAQDVYLMFTAQFRHFSPERNPYIRPPHGHWEDFGLLEIQLASSRDGIHWQRLSREPYFPTGLADEWDRWYAVMAPGIVRRGNYLYQLSSARSALDNRAYPNMSALCSFQEKLESIKFCAREFEMKPDRPACQSRDIRLALPIHPLVDEVTANLFTTIVCEAREGLAICVPHFDRGHAHCASIDVQA